MLEKLSTIEWEKTEHAYGPATDTPKFLQELLSENPSIASGALHSLQDTINHQGTITLAAVAAAPFLVEITTAPSTKNTAALLIFLANLAVGGDHTRFLQTGYNVRDKAFADCPDDHPYKKIYLDIASAQSIYLNLLSSDQPEIRCAAAFLIAFLSSFAETSINAIRQQLTIETDEKVRASLLLCLGFLNQYLGQKEDIAIFTKFSADENSLISSAALISKANLDPLNISRDEQNILISKLEFFQKPMENFPWSEGNIFNLIVLTLNRIGFMQKNSDLVISLLEKTKGDPVQPVIGSALIDLNFIPTVKPEELTQKQKDALKKILEYGLEMRLGGLLLNRGLPNKKEELEKIIG